MTTTKFELTIEAARDWKKFVADFVVMMTAKKKHRDRVDGYQVKATKTGYVIFMNGMDGGYGTMDAGTLYSWMERLPLVYLSREADFLRGELFAQAAK